MDSLTLSTLAGSVLSLVFAYVPGLNAWYSGQDGQRKSVVMLLCLALTTAGVFVVSCTGIYQVGIACDKIGAIELVKLFLAALVANQGTFLATKRL
jgi:hypothetical protein